MQTRTLNEGLAQIIFGIGKMCRNSEGQICGETSFPPPPRFLEANRKALIFIIGARFVIFAYWHSQVLMPTLTYGLI